MADYCFLDCETTGVNPYSDRIIEVALVRVGTEAPTEVHSLVNPGVPISAEATAVHEITDEMVAGAPRFREIAEHVERAVVGAILVGYNSRSFDVPLIDAELIRAGRPGLPKSIDGFIDVREIDLFRIWQRGEKRDLSTALRRFAGLAHDDAHSAIGDTRALPAVLAGMVDGLGLGSSDEELMRLTAPPEEVDRDGRFVRREDGITVFSFGKHQGQPVARNLAYLDWMLSADFSPETKAWCMRFKRMASKGKVA